ncbi:MAG: hypothetical protein FJ288_12325 [Planctomycetes bacterium]|nr:hypothetical protein [Planctomycetota bacterium]
MNRLAGMIAVLGFFVLAAAGAAAGAAPFDCAWRALAGALVLFAVVQVAGRVLVAALASSLTGRAPRAPNVKGASRERGN